MDISVTFPDPLRVAEGTYLIRPLAQAPGAPVAMHINSMLIQGPEPVIVDTGAALFREQWVEQVFSLVDPQDVRWIFLSHDDGDHTGNLELTLEMCPNATLVTSWFATERMSGDVVLPLHRQRWVGDGESFELPDRTLVAVRPPTFDSPTTRGLYDSSTGVYWTSDAFGTPVLGLIDHIDEMPQAMLEETAMAFSSMLSPWHEVVDATKFGRWVDRVAALHPTVMVGAHGPMLSGASIGLAFERMRHLPGAPVAAMPDQNVLEQLIAMFDQQPAATLQTV
ncbi:MAG: MBL fold metallo-hydrolase [Ilumatobacteraceae bacterium]